MILPTSDRIWCLFAFFLVTSSIAAAQQTVPAVGRTADTDTGIRAYTSYASVRENINLTNGNVNLFLPLLKLPGRHGLDFVVSLQYDSKLWRCDISYDPITNTLSCGWKMENRWSNVLSAPGWRFSVPSIESSSTVDATYGSCVGASTVTSSDGGRYLFRNNPGCSPTQQISTTDAEDASGMRLDGNVLIARDGIRTYFRDLFPDKIQDAEGNYISFQQNASGVISGITDSVGRTITINFSNPPYNSIVSSFTYTDVNGQPQTVTFNYGPVQLNYSFTRPYQCIALQCNPGIHVTGRSFVGTSQNITSITLPNNTQYRFEYSSYGELSKIIYPSGGYTAYEYSTQTHLMNAAWNLDGDFREISRKRVCREASGTCVTEDITTYAPTISSIVPNNDQMDVVDEAGNLTRHRFTQGEAAGDTEPTHGAAAQETGTWSYQGQSTLLFTVETYYNGGYAWSLPIRFITTLDNGLVKKEELDYDTYSAIYVPYPSVLEPQPAPRTVTRYINNVIEHREYNYGAGPPTGLVLSRRTVNTWLKTNPVNNLDYFSTSIRILSLKASEVMYDSTDPTPKAQAQYEYDNYGTDPNHASLQASGVVQHDPAYDTSYVTRGNMTAVKRWRNIDNIWLNTYSQYDDAGNILKSIDPMALATTFSYVDNFTDGINHGARAYPTQITRPTTTGVSHTERKNYFWFTGSVAASCGQNFPSASPCANALSPPQPDYEKYTYDLLNRMLTAIQGDGGQTTYAYNDVTLPLSLTTTKKITSSVNLITTQIFDGLGRVTKSAVDSDPQGQTIIDSTYDALGRKAAVSNPYRATGDPTYGITTFNYDALNRVTKVIPPDGLATTNYVKTEYCGNATLVTDQAGKWRRSITDALGRLIEVDEPNSPTATVTACPVPATDPVAVTSYSFDALNNLTSVVQSGSRQRSFTYNSLSQLTSAINPESGSICYGTVVAGACQLNGYDANGNLTAKTDARGITTTFAYDALNRLTQKTYSDTTPTVKFGYDGVAPPGCTLPTLTIANGIGRRTGMCDAAGAEAWSYDPVGRPLADARITNGITKTTSYQYNLDGSMAALTYPSGRTITYTPSAAGRTVSAVDTANAINYATSALYSPAGALASLTNGANLISSLYYNNRLQPCRMSVKSSGTAPTLCTDAANLGNVLDFTYDFSLGTANNGSVKAINNNRNPTRSQSFTYDGLNRIATAQTAATTGTNCWGESFGYDTWGNLLSIGGIMPQYTGCTQENLAVAASSANQVIGFCYDAAGNLLAQSAPPCPVPIYTYNAENQLTATAGVSYLYDGDGKRVQKSNGKLYWYGMGSDPLDETDLAGNTNNTSFFEYVFFNGKRIARRDFNNVVNYYFADHLGTARVVTNATGTVLDDSDFYPFGGERVILSSSGNNYKFTGKERDSESGLDNFGARYNSSNLARFMSPDPKILSIRHLVNPQKWNKYAYTINNPLRYFDPDGMEEIEVQLRTFIPQESVRDPAGRKFLGDNRGFSTDPNASSRTSITVRIETDASKRANPIISATSSAGQTVQVGKQGHFDHIVIANTGLPTVTGSRDADGNVRLNLQQNTKNPLEPALLTPGIKADLAVTIPQNGASVTAAGTTSGFPAIELNVTAQGQPTTNIPINDPGPNGSALSLLGTNTILVSKPLPPGPPPCSPGNNQKCQ